MWSWPPCMATPISSTVQSTLPLLFSFAPPHPSPSLFHSPRPPLNNTSLPTRVYVFQYIYIYIIHFLFLHIFLNYKKTKYLHVLGGYQNPFDILYVYNSSLTNLNHLFVRLINFFYRIKVY